MARTIKIGEKPLFTNKYKVSIYKHGSMWYIETKSWRNTDANVWINHKGGEINICQVETERGPLGVVEEVEDKAVVVWPVVLLKAQVVTVDARIVGIKNHINWGCLVITKIVQNVVALWQELDENGRERHLDSTDVR